MGKHLSDTGVPDESLMKMAQSGDRAAFETLCERYLPVVYNRCRMLLPPEAVEDVAQEVFVAALRSLRQFQGRALVRTWIAAITHNKVADFYRQRSRRPVTTALEDDGHALPAADGWEENAAVRVALRRLPTHYQEVLLFRFMDGLAFDQIAQTLGISLEAVKSRYRRAVTAIAREIGASNEPERAPHA